MFTGIVEEIGEVVSCVRDGDVFRLAVRARRTPVDLVLGASVAANGCCLTVTSLAADEMTFDLAPETLARTRFDARLRPGARVNLERPLRVSSRIEGHYLQGHVDGVGVVETIIETGSAREVSFVVPAQMARYCVPQGSIAIEGVSLTCAGVAGASVRTALIPHTLEVTTLGQLRVCDQVNVEVDMMAKYVEKLLRK